jgi:hypothetical protein
VCVPIFLQRFLSFFCERDKTTSMGINILIFFVGLMFLTYFKNYYYYYFLVCWHDLLLFFNVLKLN